MVTQSTSGSSNARRDVFQAIADPHRRAILGLLATEKLTLNGVASKFTISRPAISKHIKILEECGLVEIEQLGRERVCTARIERLSEVEQWIEGARKLWNDRFDALEQYLEELMAQGNAEAATPDKIKKPKSRTRAVGTAKQKQKRKKT